MRYPITLLAVLLFCLPNFGLKVYGGDHDAAILQRMLQYPGAVMPESEKKIFDELNSRPSPVLLDSSDHFDWREMGGVTPVKDQDGCGSCWDFGGTAGVESAILIADGLEWDLSEQQVLSCATFGYGCEGGWHTTVFNLFMDYGAVLEDCMPYQADDEVPCIEDDCDLFLRLEGYEPVQDDVNAIKNALLTGPVVTSLDIAPGFNWNCFWSEEPGPGHCVLIVGWDDNLCDSLGGGWICKNSWGTGWGDGGFFYIPYGSCDIGRGSYSLIYHRKEHNLAVFSFDAPEYAVPGDSIPIATRVVNNGIHNEADVIAHLLVNGEENFGVSIPYFERMSSQIYDFPSLEVQTGTYTLTMEILDEGVNEYSYDDNQIEHFVIVGPDVAVNSLNAPNTAVVGAPTEIEAEIENKGLVDDDDVIAYLLENGVVCDSQKLSLSVNEIKQIAFTWNPSKLGTYPISVRAELMEEEPYVENNLMTDSVSVFAPKGHILLVDDAPMTMVSRPYKEAIFENQYAYDLWERDSMGCPSEKTLLSYDATVWFTDYAELNTLDATDQEYLAKFLEQGGRIFLTGQHIGKDLQNTSFYSDYMYAHFESDNSATHQLNGIEGDPIGDGLTVYPNNIFHISTDEITPIYPATPVFIYSDSVYYGGIKVDTDRYRLVYFSFGFEDLFFHENRITLMDRILDWLIDTRDVSIDIIPADDSVVVPAGGSFEFTAILQNNTDEDQMGDVWVMVRLSDGTLYGPVSLYQQIALSPNQTFARTGITQYVPETAPPGTYDYISYWGNYPLGIEDSAFFEFTVEEPKGGKASDWKLSNWFDNELDTNIPQATTLYQNYPNPFNGVTAIKYDLGEGSYVSLDIYNILGQRVAKLVDGYKEAGYYSVRWKSDSYASGIYFCKLSYGKGSKTMRMTLLK